MRSQKLATNMIKSEHQARKHMHRRLCGMKRLYSISRIRSSMTACSYWQFYSSYVVLDPGSLFSAVFHIGCSSKTGISPHCKNIKAYL